MKRANLVEYFKLAEALTVARRATNVNQNKGGDIWPATFDLPSELTNFCNDDNDFPASKHDAKELDDEALGWVSMHLYTNDSQPHLTGDKPDEYSSRWQCKCYSQQN